jgi:hypothetical protein
MHVLNNVTGFAESMVVKFRVTLEIGGKILEMAASNRAHNIRIFAYIVLAFA